MVLASLAIVASMIDTGIKTGSAGAAFEAGLLAAGGVMTGLALGFVVGPVISSIGNAIVQASIVAAAGGYGVYEAARNGYYATAAVAFAGTVVGAYGVYEDHKAPQGANGRETYGEKKTRLLDRELDRMARSGNSSGIPKDPDVQLALWNYQQSTGSLSHQPDSGGPPAPIGTGYSGNGPGLNNPAMENAPNVGPIPQGDWEIGAPYNSPNTGPYSLPLAPGPNTNTNRTDFLIHGDNSFGNQSASHGCIVLPPGIRHQIWDSGDHNLRVVP